MYVPGWWIAVTTICFVLSTLAVVGLIVALTVVTSRVQQLMVTVSNTALPKMYGIADQVHAMGEKVDSILVKVDAESHVALPKVEHMLDRVDHTMGLVEANSERVNTVIEGTTDGINRVRQNPMTKTVLISAGSLAAARFLRNTIRHYTGGNGHAHGNGNGNGHHAAASASAQMPPGKAVLELPLDE
jgi:hypothetical protein